MREPVERHPDWPINVMAARRVAWLAENRSPNGFPAVVSEAQPISIREATVAGSTVRIVSDSTSRWQLELHDLGWDLPVSLVSDKPVCTVNMSGANKRTLRVRGAARPAHGIQGIWSAWATVKDEASSVRAAEPERAADVVANGQAEEAVPCTSATLHQSIAELRTEITSLAESKATLTRETLRLALELEEVRGALAVKEAQLEGVAKVAAAKAGADAEVLALEHSVALQAAQAEIARLVQAGERAEEGRATMHAQLEAERLRADALERTVSELKAASDPSLVHPNQAEDAAVVAKAAAEAEKAARAEAEAAKAAAKAAKAQLETTQNMLDSARVRLTIAEAKVASTLAKEEAQEAAKKAAAVARAEAAKALARQRAEAEAATAKAAASNVMAAALEVATRRAAEKVSAAAAQDKTPAPELTQEAASTATAAGGAATTDDVADSEGAAATRLQAVARGRRERSRSHGAPDAESEGEAADGVADGAATTDDVTDSEGAAAAQDKTPAPELTQEAASTATAAGGAATTDDVADSEGAAATRLQAVARGRRERSRSHGAPDAESEGEAAVRSTSADAQESGIMAVGQGDLVTQEEAPATGREAAETMIETAPAKAVMIEAGLEAAAHESNADIDAVETGDEAAEAPTEVVETEAGLKSAKPEADNEARDTESGQDEESMG